MKRRTFLAGVLALPASRVVLPDALPMRRALFEEVGGKIVMTMSLPWLIPLDDAEALETIDSGFDTVLRYELTLFEHGSRRPMNAVSHVVKIRRDPWTKRYVVSRRGSQGWTKQSYDAKPEAIAAAVRLERVEVAPAASFERGPHYFVAVIGMRNPLEDIGWESTSVSGRGRGRDLEWFGRFVELFAAERPVAEEITHVRSNAFYLVPR